MSTIGSTFRTAEPDLTKLLDQVHASGIQLPHFQRGWVWYGSHILSLIASVSKSFPIGSVMLLETGSEGVRFKPRVVEGAPEKGTNPSSSSSRASSDLRIAHRLREELLENDS